MVGLSSLREEVHNRILKLRSINNMMQQDHFEDMWDRLTPSDKVKAVKLITDIDRDGLEKFIREHRDLDYWSVSDLREEARKRSIPGWSRMCKTDLVNAITEKDA